MASETKELIKSSGPKEKIRDLLLGDKFRSQITKALPRHMSPERFARIALTATLKNPKLLGCSTDSLLNCLLELSAIGLEPDGRRAHLIPFKDQCTLLVDYKGIAELIRRNGDVAYIHCDVVCEQDQFSYWFGTGAKLEHVPDPGRVPEPPKPDKPGNVRCAYAFVRLKDGTEEFDVMSTEEIEKVRRRSRAADDGPWVTDWPEMAKKTIFRRHSKMLPLSPAIRDVIERDDEALTEQERFAHAKPAVVAGMPEPSNSARKRKAAQPAAQPELSTLSPEQAPNDSSTQFVEQMEPEQTDPSEHTQMVEDVHRLLSENGYTQEELLSVLRKVRLVTEKNPANSVAQLKAEVLLQVLEYPENTLARLAQGRDQTQK